MSDVDLPDGMRNLAGDPCLHALPLRPYDADACEFLAQASAALLGSPDSRAYPDVASFAYWCRKAHVSAQARDFAATGEVRLGRGLCLHIAPSNIPVNFAFSYAFGLLSGCANIVRIPSKPFPQVRIIVDALGAVASGFPGIAKRTAFVSYPSDGDGTASLSLLADARVVWGGDVTVNSIRALTAKPRCVDVAFADRYSVAVLSGQAVLAASEKELVRLAESFYNDTYLMDQNACSSPQFVFWLHDTGNARARFWGAVANVARERYDLQAAVSVNKRVEVFKNIIDGTAASWLKDRGGYLYVVDVDLQKAVDLSILRGRGGYFFQTAIGGLEELAAYVDGRFQTVVYYGIPPEEIRSLVLERGLKGIDRIVPVGKAMDIDIVWDGFDLVRTLSRIVDMR